MVFSVFGYFIEKVSNLDFLLANLFLKQVKLTVEVLVKCFRLLQSRRLLNKIIFQLPIPVFILPHLSHVILLTDVAFLCLLLHILLPLKQELSHLHKLLDLFFLLGHFFNRQLNLFVQVCLLPTIHSDCTSLCVTCHLTRLERCVNNRAEVSGLVHVSN